MNIDKQTFDDNWERIFGNKQQEMKNYVTPTRSEVDEGKHSGMDGYGPKVEFTAC